jgi:hypothetical protein
LRLINRYIVISGGSQHDQNQSNEPVLHSASFIEKYNR